MKVCSINGCGRSYLARGLCNTHYARWRKHGTTDISAPTDEIPAHVKPIPDYPGYFCDAAGNVYSNRRKGRHLDPIGPLKPMNLRRRPDGYLQVHCRGDAKREAPLVHQLILETWAGKRGSGLVVNHKNGDKSDNRLENLEWVTQKENIHHAIQVLKRDFRRKPNGFHSA